MHSFYKEEKTILATHKTNNISLVFTMRKGVLNDHYKLQAFVNGHKARISDKEFLPAVYMQKELFQEYSQLMNGSTSSLIERLKASCSGKGETLYRMALLLENDSLTNTKRQSYKF